MLTISAHFQTDHLTLTTAPTAHLFFGGHLSCDQEPEEALWERLLAPGGLGQQLLTLWDAVTPETDPLHADLEKKNNLMNHISDQRVVFAWTNGHVRACLHSPPPLGVSEARSFS